ncbi:hypothetical protein N781_09265 [Pontibacillus halophilus JSM 076056 = DSM 19796]|uniref:Flavoprotein n=2 Tax=Pontibacillus TaxID=289201 RepID=A0A0A5GE67_9BACI|nr:hypothetical protein N781_09265 [Pontibacillus halophilus JSM 076056 = DSM 19796]
MAAIAAAENGANTILIDKGRKLGKKLAISGGGRCNVTNNLPQDEIIKHIPGNGRFLYSAFSVFNNYDIMEFFENLGVELKEEDHGRMFPASNKAKDVVNALLGRLEELNVTVWKDAPVETIHYGETSHEIVLLSKERVETKSLVISVGGKSVPHTGSTGDGYAWAEKAGHTITDLYPTEVPLISQEAFIQDKRLQGLSLRDVALSVVNEKGKTIVTHQMDMLFTHFGISGPAVLRCSQYVVKEFKKGHRPVKMTIDCFPHEKEDKILQQARELMNEAPKRTVKNLFKGWVPERYLELLLEKNSIGTDDKATNTSLEKVQGFVKDLKHFSFHVHDSQSIEKAFVTGGGVSVKEVVPNTMASKKMDRLFFSGEILDIHGYTGGYNITSALITGRIAGTNAAYHSYS